MDPESSSPDGAPPFSPSGDKHSSSGQNSQQSYDPKGKRPIHYHDDGYVIPTSQHADRSSSQQQLKTANNMEPSIDTQDETLTSLKIRIVVLENDLAHALKAKDEAIKSSVLIARTLGRLVNDPERVASKGKKVDTGELGEPDELKLELKRLKRENVILWERIESRGDVAVKHHDPGFVLARQPQHEADPIIEAARQKIKSSDNVEGPSSDTYHPVLFNESTRLPYIVDFEKSLNSPNPPEIPACPGQNKYSDVGLNTLDDVLGEDEDNIKIEDALLYQERALANFTNIPAPAVLKVGFAPGNSFRGDDYAVRDDPRRVTYYSRFDNSTGPPSNMPPNGSQGKSIWVDDQEYNGEIQTHMRTDSRDHKFPDYFRYGVLYVPAPKDEDTFRMVHIGGLPHDTDLREVMARVRGGRVYSAHSLDTMKLLGSNSALVVFVRQIDAEAYVEYTRAHPIEFISEDEAITATVTHISTPTFPIFSRKKRSIYEFNHSRILSIRNFPSDLSLRRLQTDLACRNGFRASSLLEWYIDEQSTLWIEFSSIELARSSFEILSRWRAYKGLEIGFETDFCEGALEELREPLQPRKPMFPRSGMNFNLSNEHGRSDEDESEETDERVGAIGSGVLAQRRKLAALQNQQVVIPGCRGEGLRSSSWADEVEDADTPTEDAIGASSSRIVESSDDERESSEEHNLVGKVSKKHIEIDEPANTDLSKKARIMTGKEYLLSIQNSDQQQTSPRSPTTPPLTPSTLPLKQAPPPLTLNTSNIPNNPTISPIHTTASSAEFSLHSFDSPLVTATETVQPVQCHSLHPVAPVEADTKVYFVGGGEGAILESEVEGEGEGEGDVAEGNRKWEKKEKASEGGGKDVERKVDMKKTNPDEIDLESELASESESESGTQGNGGEKCMGEHEIAHKETNHQLLHPSHQNGEHNAPSKSSSANPAIAG